MTQNASHLSLSKSQNHNKREARTLENICSNLFEHTHTHMRDRVHAHTQNSKIDCLSIIALLASGFSVAIKVSNRCQRKAFSTV